MDCSAFVVNWEAEFWSLSYARFNPNISTELLGFQADDSQTQAEIDWLRILRCCGSEKFEQMAEVLSSYADARVNDFCNHQLSFSENFHRDTSRFGVLYSVCNQIEQDLHVSLSVWGDFRVHIFFDKEFERQILGHRLKFHDFTDFPKSLEQIKVLAWRFELSLLNPSDVDCIVNHVFEKNAWIEHCSQHDFAFWVWNVVFETFHKRQYSVQRGSEFVRHRSEEHVYHLILFFSGLHGFCAVVKNDKCFSTRVVFVWVFAEMELYKELLFQLFASESKLTQRGIE